MKNARLRILVLLTLALGLALVLGGCGRSRAEATPTPTKTPPAEGGQPTVSQPATATPVPPTTAPQAPAPAPAEPAAQPTAAPEPEVKTQTFAAVNTDLLNVRREPSTTGEVLRTVAQGEEYAVMGRTADGQWLQLDEDGRELGWVAAEFMTILGERPVAQAGEPTAAPVAQGGDQPAPTPASSGGGGFLPATMRSPDFGAQAFLWWRPEIADRDMTLMREAGFDWVKQTFAWETIEGAGKGQYDWSIADRVVQHAAEHDLKLLARLSSDPELTKFWAGKPPGNIDNFADFAYAVASRYNCTPQAVGCIQAYQVWNEPNLGREWGGNRPNPPQYTDMLRKTYAAIKRGNPNAIVINAGMAPTGDNNDIAMPDDIFYEGMYQAMGGSSNGYFDMLGVHGAGFAAPPELDPAEAAANQKYGGYRFFAFRHVEDIRRIMEKYGDAGKKIVLLEFGWTYDKVNPSYKWHGADAGIDEFVQSDYLVRAYQYAAANWQPWIGLMNLLTMPNLDWMEDGNPEDEEQYWWAIMDPSKIDELRLRPAIVELCGYFNSVKGQPCKYTPQ